MKASSPPLFPKTTAIITILVFGILASGFFLVLFNPKSANGFTPQQCIANSGSAQQTFTGSWTSVESSALLSTINLTSVCGLAGTMVVITLNFWVPGAGYTVFLTDNITDAWHRQGGGQSYTCSATTGVGGQTCTALAPMITIVFTTILSANTNRLAITANNPGGGNFPFNSNIGASWMVVPGGAENVVSSCNGDIATRSNGTQIIIFPNVSPIPCNLSVPPGDFVITGETLSYNGISGLSHLLTSSPVYTRNSVGFQNANCPANSPGVGSCQIDMGFFGNTGTSLLTSSVGWTCVSSCTSGGGGGVWVSTVGLVFGSISGTVTSTTVVNTAVQGGGSTHNSSGLTNFSPKMPTLFFYASQNTGVVGQIDNLTMKLGAVHITQNVGFGYMVVYLTQATFNPPSPSNPYVIAQSGVSAFPIFNNTGGQFVHVNPQTVICAFCFYAVGFITNTTASRTNSGNWAGTSGVSFFETTTPLSPEYKFSFTGGIPPSPMFSTTLKTPYDWLYIHETLTVGIITSTSTTSVGTVTVTSTTTSTSTFGTATVTSTSIATSLNLSTAPGNFTNYAVLLMVILTPAMIIAVPVAAYTKSPVGAGIGFVGGLMIGSALGVQAALVQPVFLGIMVIVGVFIIVGLSRAGGGTA